ncbi:hypothetical protein [Rhodoferax sp.]|uniref:hypothetical protein n=1 Tax=Rhodoferax sp. TaxID=50421 RepID=UPI00374D52BB
MCDAGRPICDGVLIALVSAAAQGLVLWGVMSTKLQWLRTDLDDLDERVNLLERRRS